MEEARAAGWVVLEARKVNRSILRIEIFLLEIAFTRIPLIQDSVLNTLKDLMKYQRILICSKSLSYLLKLAGRTMVL